MENEPMEPKYGDDKSRDIMTQIAQDLAQDISHLPPFDTFQHFCQLP